MVFDRVDPSLRVCSFIVLFLIGMFGLLCFATVRCFSCENPWRFGHACGLVDVLFPPKALTGLF